MSRSHLSHASHHLLHSQSAHERLLQQELMKLELSGKKESRSAQHSVLLRLASRAHGRHIRDVRVDTLTRLMGSDNTKKGKGRDGALRTQGGAVSAVSSKSGRARELATERSAGLTPYDSGQDDGRRRSSSSSDVSGRMSTGSQQTAGPSHRPSHGELQPSPKPRLSRGRAFSVDLLANPIVSKKRRQSAPEVVVTPAVLLQVPESLVLNHKQHRGHLSPSYSSTAEFFDSREHTLLEGVESASKGISDPSERTSSGKLLAHLSLTTHEGEAKISPVYSRKSSEGSNISKTRCEDRQQRSISCVGPTPGAQGRSGASLSLGSIHSKARKGSRSSCASRRRSSHLPQRGEAPPQQAELDPLRDPRYLGLLSCLKDVPLLAVSAAPKKLNSPQVTQPVHPLPQSIPGSPHALTSERHLVEGESEGLPSPIPSSYSELSIGTSSPSTKTSLGGV